MPSTKATTRMNRPSKKKRRHPRESSSRLTKGKLTKGKLTKKLDVIFSRYIRLQARDESGNVQCVTCDYRNQPKRLQAGHWIPREYPATRWCEWNVWPQCLECKVRFRGRPQQFREFMLQQFDSDEVEMMARERHKIANWTQDEIKDLIAHFKEEVKELEATPLAGRAAGVAQSDPAAIENLGAHFVRPPPESSFETASS